MDGRARGVQSHRPDSPEHQPIAGGCWTMTILTPLRLNAGYGLRVVKYVRKSLVSAHAATVMTLLADL